jgi:hypothetical protein
VHDLRASFFAYRTPCFTHILITRIFDVLTSSVKYYIKISFDWLEVEYRKERGGRKSERIYLRIFSTGIYTGGSGSEAIYYIYPPETQPEYFQNVPHYSLMLKLNPKGVDTQ